MISATNLRFSYGKVPVLRGVSLEAKTGATLGLIGPNGSGKTTLLRCLYGSHRPKQGTVQIDGQPLASMSQRQIARTAAVVVQENAGDLPLTVTDTILLGRAPHQSSFGRTSEEDIEIATNALKKVGALHLARRTFSNLSGGEKQRVLIAKAIAQNTPHLLMDEPTNHLDIHFQHEVLNLVRQLPQTTIIVMHDLNLAAQYCDYLVLLDEGKVRAEGLPQTVLNPDILEPIYQVRIERTEDSCGGLQLLFRHSSTEKKHFSSKESEVIE